jgi:hypothetical protein
MKFYKFLFVVPLAVASACAPGVSGTVAVSSTGYVRDPALVYVSPGVEVVADWDAPVFFSDGAYWYWDNGLWYRSAYLGGERIRVNYVPPTISRIDRPSRYVHYRPEVSVRRRPAPAYRPHDSRTVRRRQL